MKSPDTPQDLVFVSEILLKEKKFELKLDAQDDSLNITLSEKNQNNIFQGPYKETYTIESLQRNNKFFLQFENIIEIFNAIKNIITSGLCNLKEGEKEIILVINCFGKEVNLNVSEKPKKVEEMNTIIFNNILKLKKNFLKKIKELENINKSFSEVKKKNKELIEENKHLNENNKIMTEEIKELKVAIKTLKETRIENINDDIKILLENSLMTDEDRNNLRKFKGKLTGDLLNENTIAFDNLCKAYLCNWLSDSGNNKKIKTVLLYKGSRDGDKAETFHEKCNNKGATLTLVKSTTNFHFGGFTTTPWKSSGGYIPNSYSFLFSLDKKLKYPLKNSTYAVYDNPPYGPTFGGGHDMKIADGCMNNENSYSNTHSYDITDSFSGSYNFKVSEIEVYQIIFQ